MDTTTDPKNGFKFTRKGAYKLIGAVLVRATGMVGIKGASYDDTGITVELADGARWRLTAERMK